MENLEIKNMADVRSFFYYLMVEMELGGGFHPDTQMNEYVNLGTGGKETFGPIQARRLQKQLDQCFVVCEKSNQDIYEQGMDLGYAMGYYPRPDADHGEMEINGCKIEWTGEKWTANFNGDVHGWKTFEEAVLDALTI